MTKAFIHLGAGISFILPLIDYSTHKIYKPILIDRNPIKSISPWYLSKELSLDMVEEIYTYVEDLSETFDILGAYPIADYANHLAAELNKKYNPLLKNDRSIKNLRDKNLVNEIILRSKLTIPKRYFSQSKNNCDEKVIVKQRYGNDSIGAFITDLDDYRLKKLSEDRNFIVQSKVSGTLYNIDAIVQNGNVNILSINMRLPRRDNELVTRFTIQTNSIQTFMNKNLNDYVQKIVDVLDYRNGPMTIDCIIDEYGLITFLEASPFLHKPWLNKLGSGVSPFLKIAELYNAKKYNIDVIFDNFSPYVSFEYINYSNTQDELRSVEYLSTLCDEYFIDPAWFSGRKRHSTIKSAILGKVDVKNYHNLLHSYEKLA